MEGMKIFTITLQVVGSLLVFAAGRLSADPPTVWHVVAWFAMFMGGGLACNFSGWLAHSLEDHKND